MKAVVVHGRGDLRVDTVPDPFPAAGEVLVAMEWGGICGSDLAYYHRGASGTAVLKHPMILGHEVAGTIVALGDGVEELAVGTAVTFHPAQAVGDSVLPKRIEGRTNLLPQVRYFGSAAFDPHTDGGFSELRSVRVDQIRPLPDGLSTRTAAVAEPLAVALHAISHADGLLDRPILVNGCGAIGALIVAGLRYRGATNITAADVNVEALEIAEHMGATRLIDTSSSNLEERYEVSFESSGVARAVGSVLAATAKGGLVIQVGNLPGVPVEMMVGNLVTRELTWKGSYRFNNEIDDAIAALADGLDVEPLLKQEFEMCQAVEAMEAATAAGSGKVLLRLS